MDYQPLKYVRAYIRQHLSSPKLNYYVNKQTNPYKIFIFVQDYFDLLSFQTKYCTLLPKTTGAFLVFLRRTKQIPTITLTLLMV